ncbi:MAG: ABC transporter permease [Leptolyngbya sp.]|nr:ABC transporter permease [Candidatus Melainabacteria bacterium]
MISPERGTTNVQAVSKRPGVGLLFTRLAFQNLLRRPARTFMLVLAVAMATGAVFASFTVARGIESSMEQSFSRMGADLIVVPADAMVNITSALLTVQPTEALIDVKQVDEIGRIAGVARVAPQTIYRVPIMAGMPEHKANLIAFDPLRDFTVMPWLGEHLPRPMETGDILCGGRRTESVGNEIQPCMTPANIYGKLARSGVGPLDDSFFASYETVEALLKKRVGKEDEVVAHPEGVSAVLVRLAFGATPEQVRFALGRFPSIKVITGAGIVTSTRQTTTVLLAGMLGFTALMLVGSLILIGLLFSAIIAERKREVGLLRAIGARRGDIVGLLLSEACFTTTLGGLCGVLLGVVFLLGFERSLVYNLQMLRVQFIWPPVGETVLVAVACAFVSAAIGLLGALIPAWRASKEEAYSLIQGSNG